MVQSQRGWECSVPPIFPPEFLPFGVPLLHFPAGESSTQTPLYAVAKRSTDLLGDGDRDIFLLGDLGFLGDRVPLRLLLRRLSLQEREIKAFFL